MIVAIAEKKKFSDHMKTTFQRSQRQRLLRYKTCSISTIVVAAIAGEVSIRLQRSHSDHMETGLYIGQARALCYKQFLDILLTVLHVLSIQTE